MAGERARGPLGVADAVPGVTTTAGGGRPRGSLGVPAGSELVGARTGLEFLFPGAITEIMAPLFDAQTAGFNPFKQAVLLAQTQAAVSRGKQRAVPLAPAELASVEGKHELRKDAAEAARSLLAAARKDLGATGAAGRSIGIASAYRSFERETKLWNEYFVRYYVATMAERAAKRGGAHGAAAVTFMARYVGKRKAAPGYSNHSRGVAVDFFAREGKVKLSANVKQIERWKTAWFYKWLCEKAEDFDFFPYEFEPWHWDYRG